MENKFGEYSELQFEEYKKRLHSMIHYFLIYMEENQRDILEGYFDVVQTKLQGLNQLLKEPSEVVEIMVLIECARNEFHSSPFNRSKYRKLILDAHGLVNRL